MDLCGRCLSALLRIDESTVVLALRDPGLIYPLIEAAETTASCGMFLMEFGEVKSKRQESFASESLRILRYLQEKAGCRSTSRIPYSATRTLLCKIWCQVDNSVPPHMYKQSKLVDVCARWLESSPIPHGGDRQYLIRLIKNHRKSCASEIEYDLKILSLFLEGLYRSSRGSDSKIYFPENLQLLLPLGDKDSVGVCLYALLERLSISEILSLWVQLVSLVPLSPTRENIRFSKSHFHGSEFPVFSFALVFIKAATKVASERQSIDWRVTVESMLRIVAAKLSQPLVIPDACAQLTYLLKLEVVGRVSPSLLLAGPSKDMVPVVQNILSFAETMFNRFTTNNSLRDPSLSLPLEALSSLIRTLQEDLITVKAGRAFNLPKASLDLPPGPLSIARLQSIGLNPMVTSATAAVLPPDTVALLQPVAPLQGVLMPTQALVAPLAMSASGYGTGQGTEVLFRADSFAGIQNFNNTCYLSSFIQSLFLTDGFLCSIYGFTLRKLEKTEEADFVQGAKIIAGFHLLFARLLKTHHSHIEISEFIRSLPPSYRSGEQQDVTESGRWLFDKMGGTDQALVQSVFGGEMIHKTKCMGCNNITERKEVFTDLCVSVPKQAEVLGKKKVTVQSLIRKLLKPESLTGDNKYSCDTCGRKQDASRWIELTQLPNHLMLVMHKFSFDIKTCDFKKETTPVHPDDGSIDLVGTRYELYGSILHYGESAMKGHYVAIGKRSSQSSDHQARWALMDDSNVTMLSEGEAMERLSGLHKPTDSAYVLLFRSVTAPPAVNPRMPQQIIDEAVAIEAAAVHM